MYIKNIYKGIEDILSVIDNQIKSKLSDPNEFKKTNNDLSISINVSKIKVI